MRFFFFQIKVNKNLLYASFSTEGGTRTRTPKALDPKSSASTNFATSAGGRKSSFLLFLHKYKWCLNLAYALPFVLRRLRDSNPGCPFGHAGFQDQCNRPLCQTSISVFWIGIHMDLYTENLFEPPAGIEPTTYWLQISRSTSWAKEAFRPFPTCQRTFVFFLWRKRKVFRR